MVESGSAQQDIRWQARTLVDGRRRDRETVPTAIVAPKGARGPQSEAERERDKCQRPPGVPPCPESTVRAPATRSGSRARQRGVPLCCDLQSMA